jgi:hypothetical protein
MKNGAISQEMGLIQVILLGNTISFTLIKMDGLDSL